MHLSANRTAITHQIDHDDRRHIPRGLSVRGGVTDEVDHSSRPIDAVFRTGSPRGRRSSEARRSLIPRRFPRSFPISSYRSVYLRISASTADVRSVTAPVRIHDVRVVPLPLPRLSARPARCERGRNGRDRICTLIGQDSSITIRVDQTIGRLRPETFNLDAPDPTSTSEVESGVGEGPFRTLRFALPDEDANDNDGSELIGVEFRWELHRLETRGESSGSQSRRAPAPPTDAPFHYNGTRVITARRMNSLSVPVRCYSADRPEKSGVVIARRSRVVGRLVEDRKRP